MSVVMTTHGTFSDVAPTLMTRVSWEEKDPTSNAVLTEAQSNEAFYGFSARMLVKSAAMSDENAKAFVDRVLKPGNMCSCYTFVQACECPYTSWTVNKSTGETGGLVKAADYGKLNILKSCCQAELKALSDKKKSIPGNLQVADPMAQLIMLSGALSGGRRSSGMGQHHLSHVAGLEEHLSDIKRQQLVSLRKRLKDAGLEGLYEEIPPDPTLVEIIDRAYNTGSNHPSINVNDKVELVEERRMLEDDLDTDDEKDEKKRSKANKPKKGEAWGLAHHLMKVLIFLVTLRLRDVVKEVDVLNCLFIICKMHREESRDIGLHYLQRLLDYLHQSQTYTDKGGLSKWLKEPQEVILKKLRKSFRVSEHGEPLDKGQDKGRGKRRGKYGGKRKGEFTRLPRGARRQDDPPIRKKVQEEVQDDPPPRKGLGKGGENKSKVNPNNLSTELQAAFKKAKVSKSSDGRPICPFYTVGGNAGCNFGKDCRFAHECLIDKGRHPTKDCQDLRSSKAKQILGL